MVQLIYREGVAKSIASMMVDKPWCYESGAVRCADAAPRTHQSTVLLTFPRFTHARTYIHARASSPHVRGLSVHTICILPGCTSPQERWSDTFRLFSDPGTGAFFTYPLHVDYAPLAFRRSALRNVGGVDEGMSDRGECGIVGGAFARACNEHAILDLLVHYSAACVCECSVHGCDLCLPAPSADVRTIKRLHDSCGHVHKDRDACLRMWVGLGRHRVPHASCHPRLPQPFHPCHDDNLDVPAPAAADWEVRVVHM